MNTLSHKNIAVNFLNLVTKGNIREAYKTYTSSTFIHHNPHFKGDRESLAQAMEENHNLFPNKTYEVKHVLEDDDLVAVHGRVQLFEGGKTIAVVHIFRFEDDKIVELWDVGQEIPQDSLNEQGMF
jgi:predicted SnoaL-like aldol condensation-catalyzing enzyme